ncbi:translation initiation factor IF-2 like protein [Tanacetum coccineum]
MKFLHSPSSSSSTSEPNYATTSCIPSLLRRLLCFHTLPTLPFDHYHHENEEFCESNEFDEVCGDSMVKGDVGIVAKLMGLDSMPTQFRKKVRCGLHVPSFVEVENDDKFIVLSFEELNLSKRRKGLGDKKNQEKRACGSQDFDGGGVNSSESGFDKNCERMCDKKGKLRKKLVEKDEIESDSENSSPVSVLEFPDHQEASNSGKEGNLNSRRKLRGDLDKNVASPLTSSLSISCNTMIDGVEIGKRYAGLKKKNFVSRRFKKTWEESCIRAEKDVMDSSRKQKERWKGEDFEEIGVCLESQILDQLILELITIT